MNYQEFKRNYAKTLADEMRRIGFIKGKSEWPTFWHHPHDDQRLAWVVCFDFSARGNPLFNILIGPYWLNERLSSQDPFPRCVGYKSQMGPEGIVQAHYWDATPKSFTQAVSLIDTKGREFLGQYRSPEALLKLEPRATLAFDLGDFAQARVLAEVELTAAYANEYSKAALSGAGKKIQQEFLERSESLLEQSLAHLGQRDELERARAAAAVAAAKKVLSGVEPMLKDSPNSRWVKATIKKCQEVIKNGA